MAITLIDKIKPKNNGTFPLVDAEDVLMPDGKRLSEREGVSEEYVQQFVTEFATQNLQALATKDYVQEYVAEKLAEIPDVSEVGM